MLPGLIPVFNQVQAAPFALTHSMTLASGSTQYLTRSFGAPTSTTKATMAFWYKLVSAITQTFYDSGPWGGVTTTQAASLTSGGVVDDNIYNGATSDSDLASNAAAPIDTTTWHHLCIAYDTTQGTAANRGHMYFDGTEVTYGGSNVYPASSATIHWTANGITAQIGRVWGGAGQIGAVQYTNAKLADYFLIDGQQLTPSSFITGTGSGTCHPKAFSGGAFGNNGFRLDFGSSNTNDSSGNGNNWTAINAPSFTTDVPT